MKLKSYILLGLSLLAFSSCDEDFSDWVNQDTNTQGEAIKFGSGSVSEVSVIKLADYADDTDSIKICSIVEPTSTYSSTSNAYVVSFNGTEYKLDSEGRMKFSDLKSYVESTYGKRPVERDMAATVIAYTGDGKTAVKSVLAKSDAFSVKVVPASPYIDPAGYYVVGSVDGWGLTKVDAFHMVNSGADVYDDPVFTATIPAPAYADVYEIKIAPSSAWNGSADGKVANWSQVLSAVPGNSDVAYSGNFSYDNSGGNIRFAGKENAKFYVVTVNVLEGTYKIDAVEYPTFLYEIGNNTGWSGVQALFSPNNDGVFTGAFYLKSGFKFRSNANNWDGYYNLGWNATQDEGVLLNSGGSGDIKLAEDGHYFVKVNIADMTYSLQKFTSMGVIGGAQPGGWDKSTDMTYDAANKCWYVSNIKLNDGEIKFCSDNRWDMVNLGSDLNKLIQDGGNITVVAGTYNIKLYLDSDTAPHATLEKVN